MNRHLSNSITVLLKIKIKDKRGIPHQNGTCLKPIFSNFMEIWSICRYFGRVSHRCWANMVGCIHHWGKGVLQNFIWGLSQYIVGACGGLKMVVKNTSEGVHLSVNLPSISPQACKFTKNKLHENFSMILGRF